MKIYARVFGLFFILCVCSVSTRLSQAQETSVSEQGVGSWWKKNFRYSGELRQETAFRFVNSPNFSKIKQFAKVNLKFQLNEHLTMKLGGRGYYDAVYDLTDQYPILVKDDMSKELQLRDAYLDIFAGKLQVRIGHQQIVWGEALGQFFADVVTPKDLREFLLPPFEEVREPIWALDLRYSFLPDASLEIVVSPDQSVDRLAPQGADFAFFIPPPPPGVEQILLDEDQPEFDFRRWNVGARISYLIQGWDLSWLYYTSPAHEPTLFKTLGSNPETGQPQIILDPQNRRVHHFGMTFSKNVSKSILRGEFVWTLGRYFNAKDIAVNEGVVQRPQLRYVLGFDAALGGKVDMNAEFQQAVIFGSTLDLADPVLQSWIFLRFETGFLNEKLIPEMIFIVGIIAGDTQISPRLHYRVADTVTLTWGIDIWTGPLDTLYGEFRGSDRVYMNTSWKF